MCRSPSGLCSLPDRTGLNQRLIRGLWLTQARGREGTVVIIGMSGEPAAAEANMMFQQPEAHCVLLGKLSLDHRTLAGVGCTGSQGGVDSDLLLRIGFLMAAAAALESHACLWCLR